MRIPKFVLIILLLIAVGAVWYIFSLKNDLKNAGSATTTSTVTVTKGKLTESINVTGKAELANEQKLRFVQNGKIAEIFVKVGDSVEKDQVLATVDKREFFQELAQAQNRIDKTNREIANEREKSSGVEAARMEREIASMMRKLEEMEEDLSRAIQNSPGKSQEKILDINAKKRELQEKKDKYENDRIAFEKEWENREKLATSKVSESRKVVENTIQNAFVEANELQNIFKDFNKVVGFDPVGLTENERDLAEDFRMSANFEINNIQNNFRNIDSFVFSLKKKAEKIDRNSMSADEARDFVDMSLRTYNLFLDTIENTHRVADNIFAGDDERLEVSELSQIISNISTLRTKISAKITSLKESRDALLLIDTPERAKEKFLQELNNKKLALEASLDAIKKLEIQISQEEK